LNLPEDLKETLKLISKGEHAGSIEKQMQPMNFEEGVPDNKTLASKSELTQSRTDGLPQEMKDLLSKSNLSTGRLMQAINNAIKELVTKDSSEIKQDIKQLLNSTEYKKLMAEHIKNQLFLEPGEVAKENAVAKLYDKLETELKQVRTVLEETTNLDSKLLATTKGLQENIEFMRNLNDVFTYIQIPLKLKNQNASSELYVFTDKEEIKKNKGNISALLHLDLANLGILDIYINKQEKNIQSQFYCDDEVIREALEKNISKLIAPLEAKGYNIYTQIAKREEKVEFVKDFINIGGEQLSLKRYSFDVRA
jgi:flagellar hook-length control protein FliK